jgi:hypothetical protein
MNTHQPVTLVGGDDWQLNATMLDPAGNNLDLSNASVLWTLLDETYKEALPANDFVVTIGPGVGQCSVSVPATSTTKLSTARYYDFWRVVISGVHQTLLCGQINAQADPWGAETIPSEQDKRKRGTVYLKAVAAA